jgi:hypothetical protein
MSEKGVEFESCLVAYCTVCRPAFVGDPPGGDSKAAHAVAAARSVSERADSEA